MNKNELLIFRGLLQNDEYFQRTFPYIKPDYFASSPSLKILHGVITDYIMKYGVVPNKLAIETVVDNIPNVNETVDIQLHSQLDEIYNEDFNVDVNGAIDLTEKYCQEVAITLAIQKSIEIIDGEEKKLTKAHIPELLQTALSVSFDTSVGHEYFDDAEKRYEFYHNEQERIPFNIQMLNSITKNGLPKKSLACIIAPTGVGKSTLMCDFAASNLMKGKNVLYITMEMSQEMISERIDANLMDMVLDDVPKMSKERYLRKIESIRAKTSGKLIVKEYPTGEAGAGHFRYLLTELKTKKGFIPDVIYLDYLNLCSSSRVKSRDNSYILVKSIAEEIRALSVETNTLIITASQTNRSGQGASDYDLSEVSESHGLSMTCDFMIAVISTPELESMKKIRIKQFKNRYGSISENGSFLVGIDRAKMKLYDVDNGISNTQTTKVDRPKMQEPVHVSERDDFFALSKKSNKLSKKDKKPLVFDDDDAAPTPDTFDIMNIKPVMKPGFENPLDDSPPWD